MNIKDDRRAMYVRYTPGSPANGNAPKLLRAYVAVPAEKIKQGRQGNPYSDKDIAHLNNYWKICLDFVPEELQYREPNYAENGISFWKITG
jgi:hypothetical protein